MGNNSSTVPPPPPDPRMAALYNTQARMVDYRSVAQHRPQMNSSEISRMKLDSYIDKSKTRIVEIQEKVFDLWIWFSSKTMCQIDIGFYTREDQGNLICSVPAVEGMFYRNPFYPSEGQEFKVLVDLRALDYSQIFVSSLYHIYIDIFSVAQAGCPVLRTFYNFSRVRERISLMLKKQTIIIGGVPTVLLDFYGKETNGENLCLICLTENRDTMILPCRHVCLCQYCSDRLGSQISKICPICRTRVSEFVRIIE